jgi:glycosyltransferase involved in cell wall biosynthesis
MSCGTPVLAANATSLPEVAGEAGILLDPNDPQAWTEGVVRLLTDQGLRKELAQKGLERAAGFTWARCARETWAVLTG